MPAIARILAILLALTVAAQSLVLWRVTGQATFTRFATPNQKPITESGSLDELLGEAGLEEEAGPMPRRENAFALGLLPAGADAHAISVLTIAGPAIAAGALAWRPRRRRIPAS